MLRTNRNKPAKKTTSSSTRATTRSRSTTTSTSSISSLTSAAQPTFTSKQHSPMSTTKRINTQSTPTTRVVTDSQRSIATTASRMKFQSPATSSQSASMPMVSVPSRNYQPRQVKWVRRGIVSDRKPNMRKKAMQAVASEMFFLASPLSHVKPKGSLNDKFLRMRLQYYDQYRNDHPELDMPEQIPYEIDRVPRWWPKFEVYCKKEAQQPLVFYRKQWLRYEEPSFIHVVRVQDKLRTNKYGRRTVLTAWQTWRGVTGVQPNRVKSTSKRDWMQLNPELGLMTDEIWNKLRNNEIPKYELPEPPCFDNSLEPEYLERENKRFEDIIESTRSKVV